MYIGVVLYEVVEGNQNEINRTQHISEFEERDKNRDRNGDGERDGGGERRRENRVVLDTAGISMALYRLRMTVSYISNYMQAIDIKRYLSRLLC